MAVSKQQREAILQHLANGLSLRKSCREADLSEASRFLEECDRDDALAAQYARARERGYQARADALLDTASDETIEPASRRIITDTMKWELSKMLPKVYGDKLDLNHSGQIRTGAQGMSDDELLAIAAQAKARSE
jgi:hypothetical protein